MGILEKMRAEFVDIVEWIDDDRQSIVWRFPRYHNQIKQGAKLIVRPGQLAVFVHRGKLADRFAPGTHVLETGNLPLLSTIAGWSHGFDSPFKAEIYFVATRQVTDLKWGTPNPVILRDPELGAVRVRGFGTYTLRASNPEKLLTEIVGADSQLEAAEIGDLLRSIIVSEFADLIAASDIPVIDLAANYRILAEKLRNAVVTRVREEFGLEFPQLVLANVSVPEEVERALDARSSISVIGDLARYQQYQVGQSMPIAAANPAGGVAGAGVGLGMGLAAVGQMAGTGVGVLSQPPPLASAAPGITWHFEERGRATGPFTSVQIDEAIAAGRVGPMTLVWSPGMPSWVRAAETPALSARFGPPPLPR
jgi:membrane protease subunit (stomatin/prohibitin family)